MKEFQGFRTQGRTTKTGTLYIDYKCLKCNSFDTVVYHNDDMCDLCKNGYGCDTGDCTVSRVICQRCTPFNKKNDQ